jgi:uncharacterized protein YbaR (Trm112 family)
MHSLNDNQSYFQALSCPCCETGKLFLTKEKIIICQNCLKGFRIKDDVPDFRIEHAISFVRKSEKKSSVETDAVLITILIGENKNQNVSLKNGHCVILGRLVGSEMDSEKTFVGKPNFTQVEQFVRMDSDNQKLAEIYLKRNLADSGKNISTAGHQRFLGDFIRNPDFMIADTAVSRSHAVIFQDDEGVRVLDMVSRNGTFVNGKEIEFAPLKNNDVVSIGNTSMRVNFK